MKLKLLLFFILFLVALPLAFSEETFVWNRPACIINEITTTNVNGTINTNETVRVDRITDTNCTGQVVAGFFQNGTGYCEADDSSSASQWIINRTVFANNSNVLSINNSWWYSFFNFWTWDATNHSGIDNITGSSDLNSTEDIWAVADNSTWVRKSGDSMTGNLTADVFFGTWNGSILYYLKTEVDDIIGGIGNWTNDQYGTTFNNSIQTIKVNNASFADDCALLDGQDGSSYLTYNTSADMRNAVGWNNTAAGIVTNDFSKNVGIRTSSPSDVLTVAGATDADLRIEKTEGTTSASMEVESDSGKWWLGTYGSGATIAKGSAFIWDRDNSKIPFIIEPNVATNTLYLDNTSSNVGIGTTSPAAKLTIDGSSVWRNVQVGLLIKDNSVKYPRIGFENDNNKVMMGLYDDDNFKIYTSADLNNWDASDPLAIAIDTSGNVGIGTGTPNQTLDVNGNIQYTGSLIDASDPDIKGDIEVQEDSEFNFTELKQYSWRYKDYIPVYETINATKINEVCNEIENITICINETIITQEEVVVNYTEVLRNQTNYGFLATQVPSKCRYGKGFDVVCVFSEFVTYLEPKLRNLFSRVNILENKADIAQQKLIEKDQQIKEMNTTINTLQTQGQVMNQKINSLEQALCNQGLSQFC